MKRDVEEAVAVLEILVASLKVVEQAIDLGTTEGLHKFIEKIEELAQTEKVMG